MFGLGRSVAIASSSSEDSDDEVVQKIKRERVRKQRWAKREVELEALVRAEKKERRNSTSSDDSLFGELRSEIKTLNTRLDTGTTNISALTTDLTTEFNAFESSVTKLSKIEAKVGPCKIKNALKTEKILEFYDSLDESSSGDEEIVYEYVTASSDSDDDLPSLQEQLKSELDCLKKLDSKPKSHNQPANEQVKGSSRVGSVNTCQNDRRPTKKADISANKSPRSAPIKKPIAHKKNPTIEQMFIPKGKPESIFGKRLGALNKSTLWKHK